MHTPIGFKNHIVSMDSKGQMGIQEIGAAVGGLVLVAIGLAIVANTQAIAGVENSFLDLAETFLPVIVLLAIVAVAIGFFMFRG